MAVIASATAVGTAIGLGTGAAALIGGGAIIGAGVGGLYSAVTGDGNILNSMLTGGLIGGAAGGIGAAFAPAAGGTGLTTGAGAAKGITAGVTPAASAYGGASSLGSVMPAVSSPIGTSLAAPTLSTPLTSAYGVLGGAGAPAGITATQTAAGLGAGANTTALTGAQKLGLGLAGTTALSMIGAQNQPTLQEDPESPSYIRPYTYSQKRNPNYGQPGESYFTQSYTAGEPYEAASGGIMRMAEGGAAQPIVPMQQLAAPVTTYGAQRPVSQAVTDYNQLIAQRAQNEYNVQPAPLSTLPGGGQYAGEQDVNKIINRYYQQNLARTADKPGLDFWTNAVREGALTLGGVNKAIQDSPEAQARRKTLQEQQTAQQQAALESSPAYQSYMSAPITEANFDATAYLSANPDVGNRAAWVGTPWQHYSQYGANEGRTASRLPFQSAPAQSGQSGYTYNPITQSYTAPSAATPAQEGSGLADIYQDPNFQAYLQNQYNQHQQAQYGGGGAAGGLMPGALKYNMGGNVQGYNLGGYSDGGRLLKGPGDGVSDDIPAVIGDRQPARLADGEFVIPARIVSELGNGSTDAGAKRLYAMMDKIQAGRKKTVGKGNVAKDTKAKKHLLA